MIHPENVNRVRLTPYQIKRELERLCRMPLDVKHEYKATGLFHVAVLVDGGQSYVELRVEPAELLRSLDDFSEAYLEPMATQIK